jgi:hypothetical protein
MINTLLNQAPTQEELNRQQVFEQMTPALQEIVVGIAESFRRRARGDILVAYNVGYEVKRVLDDDARYGSRAVERMAEFLDCSTSYLYNHFLIVRSFNTSEIEQLTKLRMRNGQHLTPHHVLEIARERKFAHANLIRQTIEESLSVRQLHFLILSNGESTRRVSRGGRKHKRPKSVQLAVAKMLRRFESDQRFLPVALEWVDELLGLEEERITPDLLANLHRAIKAVREYLEVLAKLKTGLQKAVERAENVLRLRDERRQLAAPEV